MNKYTDTYVTEARSGVDQSNISEILEAEDNKGFSAGKQEQYETPLWLSKECWDKLPFSTPSSCLDPQAFNGNLLCKAIGYHSPCQNYAIELDNRVEYISGARLITANCMKVFDIIEDIHPNLRFVCINANPPFGRRWKKPDGTWIDSTQATWDFATRHGNMGFFIANKVTIEKLGLHKSPLVYDYTARKMSDVWKDMRDGEIGILQWQRENQSQFTHSDDLRRAWEDITKIVDDEKSLQPKFNIYLDHSGILKTYLSIRSGIKLKVSYDDGQKLHRINDARPLSLVTEVETRRLLKSFLDAGIYTIEPAAKEAMQSALDEVDKISCPIMKCSEFESVAYCDDLDMITCINSEAGGINLTKGKQYPLRTFTYKYSESFTRNKVHFNEYEMRTYTSEHQCILSGQDRCIAIVDDARAEIRFMDKPRKQFPNEHEEKLLWKYFEKPEIKTVCESLAPLVVQNMAVLKALEMTAGYKYLTSKNGGGQMGYIARLGVKNAALAAAETGAGKTLIAISLLAMKSPDRTLIIAPQGAVRPVASDDEDDESEGFMDASQWVREITRFAPYMQVFELFTYEDYQRLCAMNGGQLPYGVFITYWEAAFSNGAKEKIPDTWDDHKFNAWAKSMGLAELPVVKNAEGQLLDRRFNCNTVGREENGIRCIIDPCLMTQIGHNFDCVMVDEAQKATNLHASLTQMLIRMQPKYRYALTATPIPNIISNLFSLMGWLACDQWYKGGILNAAFPYAREDIGKFNSTFLSTERDVTQEELNRRKDPKWRGTCVKESPIISSPARLLKILKPTMAFISKQDVNDQYIPPKTVDVRVPMGKEQSALYGHFLKRENIPAKNPLVRARKQIAYLRNICADPAGFTHGGPKVQSNLNPKVIAMLELVRDILARGEQVLIVNARVGLTTTLHEKLCEAGIPIARIDSTVLAEMHSQQAKLFTDRKVPVTLMGIKCASAYSFDGAENEIIGSLEFSPGPLEQAKGRVDRVTNNRVKNIYIILHKDSYDEIQYDLVGTKFDAAQICLRGQRVPRDYVPLGSSDILAKAIERFSMDGSTPESECEQKWPALRDRITRAYKEGWKK